MVHVAQEDSLPIEKRAFDFAQGARPRVIVGQMVVRINSNARIHCLASTRQKRYAMLYRLMHACLHDFRERDPQRPDDDRWPTFHRRLVQTRPCTSLPS